jgi:hypothetical protein
VLEGGGERTKVVQNGRTILQGKGVKSCTKAVPKNFCVQNRVKLYTKVVQVQRFFGFLCSGFVYVAFFCSKGGLYTDLNSALTVQQDHGTWLRYRGEYSFLIGGVNIIDE